MWSKFHLVITLSSAQPVRHALKHTFGRRGQRKEEFFIYGHAHDKDLARRSTLQKCSTNGTDMTRFVFEDYRSENYKMMPIRMR